MNFSQQVLGRTNVKYLITSLQNEEQIHETIGFCKTFLLSRFSLDENDAA